MDTVSVLHADTSALPVMEGGLVGRHAIVAGTVCNSISPIALICLQILEGFEYGADRQSSSMIVGYAQKGQKLEFGNQMLYPANVLHACMTSLQHALNPSTLYSKIRHTPNKEYGTD